MDLGLFFSINDPLFPALPFPPHPQQKSDLSNIGFASKIWTSAKYIEKASINVFMAKLLVLNESSVLS